MMNIDIIMRIINVCRRSVLLVWPIMSFTVGGGVLQGGDRPAAACLILRYVNVTTSGCLNYLLREARHGETKEKIG